jgi:hypothetical protein
MTISWPGFGQVFGDERADVAPAGDDDLHQCPPLTGPLPRCVETLDGIAADHGVKDVAVLHDGVGTGHTALAEPGQRRHPGVAATSISPSL